jgi:cell division protein FtsB
MQDIIAIIMIFSIPLVAIIGGLMVKSQRNKLEFSDRSGDNKALKKQIGNLMAENEAIKDRLENLEYLLLKEQDPKTRIELTEYEKEQIKLDNKDNPFKY